MLRVMYTTQAFPLLRQLELSSDNTLLLLCVSLLLLWTGC
jgi:hypothetical protein